MNRARLRGATGLLLVLAIPSPVFGQPDLELSTRPAFVTASDLAFGGVSDLALFPDGSVAVADGMSRTVTLLSPSGARVSEFGREGSGPGEFRHLNSAQVLGGDTIAVFDVGSSRLSKFSRDGAFLRDHTIRVDGFSAIGSATQVGEELLILTGVVIVGPGSPGYSETTYRVAVHDLATSATEKILELQGPQIYRSSEGYVVRAPVLRSKNLAIGDRVYAGSGEAWAIHAYDLGGDRVGTLTRPSPDLRLSRSDFRAITETLLERLSNDEARRNWRRVYSEMAAPEAVPAYDKLLVGTENRVWARHFDALGDEPEVWSVFVDDGFVGEVTMPVRFELVDVNSDWIAGIVRDEFGVPSVAVYLIGQ